MTVPRQEAAAGFPVLAAAALEEAEAAVEEARKGVAEGAPDCTQAAMQVQTQTVEQELTRALIEAKSRTPKLLNSCW